MSSNIKQQAKCTSARTIVSCLFVLLVAGLSLVSASMQLVEQIDQAAAGSAARSSGTPTATLAVIESPELTARVLETLLRSILYSVNNGDLSTLQSAQKRGLDLGISRGFSGSQAGKHLMGLSAASFANGPGR